MPYNVNLPETYKWKIESVKNDGLLSVIMKVTFGYGWQLHEEEYLITPEERDEEGNIIQEAVYQRNTYYTGFSETEEIKLPALMTQEQVKVYLNTYWGDKYAILDQNAQIIEDLKGMAGTKEG